MTPIQSDLNFRTWQVNLEQGHEIAMEVRQISTGEIEKAINVPHIKPIETGFIMFSIYTCPI